VNADASTHENNDANTYFTSGKAAMVQMFPFVIKDFEKALGKDLGVTRLPQSGPNPGRTAANSFHNWVIPKNAKNKDGGWEFIKMAVDDRGASALATTVGALPTNKIASGRIKDPLTRFFLRTAANPQIALLYYQQLQAAFSGKISALEAMQNVDKGLKSLNP
jgi:ABC-type glycerol-3-phosphate transport system substrate-binding protein